MLADFFLRKKFWQEETLRFRRYYKLRPDLPWQGTNNGLTNRYQSTHRRLKFFIKIPYINRPIMIKIDHEQKKIHFFLPYRVESTENNAPPLSFDLISAYICPVCNKIIRAYYIGFIPKEDIGKYIEKIGSNDLPEMQLVTGNACGGQYLKNTSHFDKYSRVSSCKWEEIPLRGVKNCLEALFEKLDEQKKNIAIPEKLIELVSKNEFEGIKLVPDVCGKDEPMLVFNEDTLAGIDGAGNELDLEERWKRKENIIDAIMKRLNTHEQGQF